MLREIILPLLADRGLPLAMMIGSTPRVNPDLDEAGDMVGKAEITTVTQLCARVPPQQLPGYHALPREPARAGGTGAKFRNLMVFGCWWFLNTPSLVEEITQMRLELLGATFIPQHSDARLLEQLIYKWQHSRAVIADVLARAVRQTFRNWLARYQGSDHGRRAASFPRQRGEFVG